MSVCVQVVDFLCLFVDDAVCGDSGEFPAFC